MVKLLKRQRDKSGEYTAAASRSWPQTTTAPLASSTNSAPAPPVGLGVRHMAFVGQQYLAKELAGAQPR